MQWSKEDEAKLARLIASGDSYSVISAKFAGKYSRASVGGKVFRLGLKIARPPVSRKPKPAHRPDRQPDRRAKGRAYWPRLEPEPMPAPAKAPDPGPEILIPTLELQPHHCRAVYGAPGEPRYGHCGAEKVPGTSWCAFHLDRYIPELAVKLRQPTRAQSHAREKEVQS